MTVHRLYKKKKNIVTFFNSVESNCVLKMSQNPEKIRHILQYHFDQGDNKLQACEKISGVYGDVLLKQHMQ